MHAHDGLMLGGPAHGTRYTGPNVPMVVQVVDPADPVEFDITAAYGRKPKMVAYKGARIATADGGTVVVYVASLAPPSDIVALYLDAITPPTLEQDI